MADDDPPLPQPATWFAHTETAARIRALRAAGLRLEPDGAHRWLRAADATGATVARIRPPLIQPWPADGDLDRFVAEAARSEPLGRHDVVLVQAGATALGAWCNDALLAHKAAKRYVVRGSGRAQPLHAKTKGKSRYGARLRLQNHRRLMAELGERWQRLWHEHGPARLVFVSCPIRTWVELHALEPGPPFDQRDPRLRRVPLDTGVPTFEELLRVHRLLTRGCAVGGDTVA